MAPVGGCLQRVFAFRKGRSEGDKSMKNLLRCELGGDVQDQVVGAAGIHSVDGGLLGVNEEAEKHLLNDLWEEILEALGKVEEDMGAHLGDPSRQLLLSICSDAANLWRLTEQVQKQSPYAASATKGGEDDDNHVSELVPGEIFERDAEDKQAL
ncbi:hypothetical protein ZIOFF_002669 [Zingiber officinale]|uniref:Uncharacterized protein n=1 Tax=Zingiber officinale TaxID=94328 RepID=A0A8J5IM77_ZINOF|nr:hypothetical protein ZIOFF_002669 [Zingiber officinale]